MHEWSKDRACKMLRFTVALCNSRKLSSFYEFLLRLRPALFVFWGILRREKKAQRTYGSRAGWLWVLPTEQLCWQLAGAGLLGFPEKTSQAEVQPFHNRGACFLVIRRNWEETMRSRNKKSTEGGSESRKNQTSPSTRDYMFSCSLSGIIPDTVIAFVQLCYFLLSHMRLLYCPKLMFGWKAWCEDSMRCRIYWFQVLPE